MLKNIGIVLRKEYWVRVRRKAFILSTLLTPIGFILLAALPALITIWSNSSENLVVWVIDEKNLLGDLGSWSGSSEIEFRKSEQSLEHLKQEVKGKEEAILVLPESFDPRTLNATLYSSSMLSINAVKKIKDKLQAKISEFKLVQAKVSKEQRELLDFDLELNTVKILDKGEEKTSSFLAAGIGYVMALLIYLFLLMYGSMVMMGVIEEKSNRIMEIIISAVKPMELMIGKIIGIGLVGLTQFTVWVVLVFIFNFVLGFFVSPEMPVEGSQLTKSEVQNILNEVYFAMSRFKWSLIFHFIFYFCGGYLIYGSLFAAIGSMMDSESDAQQLSFVVILPVMIPILLLGNFIQSPNGGLAVFMSIFPLFSSITMMIRLAATDVPFYQVLLSQILLVLGVVSLGWLSARIFRVGILLYGKRYSIRDAIKWIFSKNI